MQAVEKYPLAISVLSSMPYGGVKVYDHVLGDITNRCNPLIQDHIQKDVSRDGVQARAATYSEISTCRCGVRHMVQRPTTLQAACAIVMRAKTNARSSILARLGSEQIGPSLCWCQRWDLLRRLREVWFVLGLRGRAHARVRVVHRRAYPHQS